MPTFAVLYQKLNADSRKQAFAAQFVCEHGSLAIEQTIYLYGKDLGFTLLTISEMK